MGIQVDWQIIEEDELPITTEAPAVKPRDRPRLRWRLIVPLLLAVSLIVASAASALASLYRSRLGQAAEQVNLVAHLEAKAIATNDKISFMALQDAEDDAWRAAQSQHFARLEREGFSEFGWKAMGVAPRPGAISLEPGGARLDVMYHFSIAQPMPAGR